MRTGLIVFLILAFIGVGWVLLGRLAIIAEDVFTVGAAILAALYFILAMPLSILLKVDSLRETISGVTPDQALFVVLLIVILNWSILGLLKRVFKI